MYFWTVTFREARHDWVQSERFTAFLAHLKRHLDSDIGGVKVAELHPGGHGVHFHLLVNRRISVHVVRRVGRVYGIGRIQVKVADQNAGAATEYLAKYMCKGGDRPHCESGRNMRRWAAFGAIPHRCRCSDIVYESPMWDFRRKNNFPVLPRKWWLEGKLERAFQRGIPAFRLAYLAARDGNFGMLTEIVDKAGVDVVLDGVRGTLTMVHRFSELEFVAPF